VKLSIEINFRFGDALSGSSEPPAQLRYAFSSPPGITSLEPDSEGVYPLSKRLEMPKISEFVSKGFAAAAMFTPDGTACRLLLTIDSKGKPSNAQILKVRQTLVRSGCHRFPDAIEIQTRQTKWEKGRCAGRSCSRVRGIWTARGSRRGKALRILTTLGASYPAMLVKTSSNDSKVMYRERAKHVAKLRTLKTDNNPLLLVTNMEAGHGERADVTISEGNRVRLRFPIARIGDCDLGYCCSLWKWKNTKC
jgi:hypothetical protein